MSQYFGPVKDEDIQNFLKDQQEVRGDEFEVPTIEQTIQSIAKPAESKFAMYREALGAARSVKLSNNLLVIVGKPKVKTIKYLLSIIDALQEKAESKNPIETLEEFEKIMLQCLKFPTSQNVIEAGTEKLVPFVEPKTLEERSEWFNDLDADDGLLLAENFSQVFDIKYLLSRSSGIAGKN